MGLSMGLSMGLCMRNSFCWVRQHRDIMGTARRCIWIDEEVGDTVGQEEDDRGGGREFESRSTCKNCEI
jgi:hypothetical protein